MERGEPYTVILSGWAGEGPSQVKTSQECGGVERAPESHPTVPSPLNFPSHHNINGSSAPARHQTLTERINKSVSLWSSDSPQLRPCYNTDRHNTITMELHSVIRLSTFLLALGHLVTPYQHITPLEQLTVRIEDHVTSRNCNRTLTDLEVSSSHSSNCQLSLVSIHLELATYYFPIISPGEITILLWAPSGVTIELWALATGRVTNFV